MDPVGVLQQTTGAMARASASCSDVTSETPRWRISPPSCSSANAPAIEELTGRRLAPGSLYRALSWLEGRELIRAAGEESEAQERHRIMRITDAGCDQLRADDTQSCLLRSQHVVLREGSRVWWWEVAAMSWDATAHEVSRVMHVRCLDRLPGEAYRQVLEQLVELSPVVQALSPSAALVELKGALRHHGADARRLGEVLRVRTFSRLGIDTRVGIDTGVGIGPSITAAATAFGQIALPGRVLAVDPAHVAEWLGALPVEAALHGIGPRQAKARRDYGIHHLGLLAAVPPATAQRLLGGGYGRLAGGPAGLTHAPSSRALPASASATVSCAFPGRPLTAPESAWPCSIWSSGSGTCCAAVARRPAL